MKTFILFFVALLAGAITADAQNLIAVQKGGAPAFYTDLPTAISKTVVGDTVYVPGGSYPAITISQKLYLIGVGANPDSSKVSGKTIIMGITLGAGSDNGSITGIYTFGLTISNSATANNGTISGIKISRCNIAQMSNSENIEYVGGGGYTSNFIVEENIIGSLSLDLASSYVLNNNIFTGVVTINNSYIRNNLFLVSPGPTGLTTSYSIVENNIFEVSLLSASSFYSVSGNSNFFNNNADGGINTSTGTGTANGNSNQGVNNTFAGALLNAIFPTYNPANIKTDAIYEMSFNLASNSPYKNYGTDGTDIGIYGGAYPWKAGSIPSNPHFQSIKVGPTTDSSGNLKVQITVAAQNN